MNNRIVITNFVQYSLFRGYCSMNVSRNMLLFINRNGRLHTERT